MEKNKRGKEKQNVIGKGSRNPSDAESKPRVTGQRRQPPALPPALVAGALHVPSRPFAQIWTIWGDMEARKRGRNPPEKMKTQTGS